MVHLDGAKLKELARNVKAGIYDEKVIATAYGESVVQRIKAIHTTEALRDAGMLDSRPKDFYRPLKAVLTKIMVSLGFRNPLEIAPQTVLEYVDQIRDWHRHEVQFEVVQCDPDRPDKVYITFSPIEKRALTKGDQK